jgi:hypothetical protein
MNENEVKFETEKHISNVSAMIDKIIVMLMERSINHDKSKLEEPEFSTFMIYTEKLKDSIYGSDEYNQSLKEMKPALDHHYANNRHHPEHYTKYVCNECSKEYIKLQAKCDQCGHLQLQAESDISQMNIVDLIEMICDWKAATLRSADGNLKKSIEINSNRFKINNQLKQILLNSVDLFD